ncbi:MAG: hypothetical protein ACM3SQ_14950 [Betaproteobacteria bacterium]
MNSRALAGVLLVACLLTPARGSAADAPTTFRIFLKDGHSLVSYGEFALVNDRIVFSMPTDASADAPLQLVNLPADRVDWPRTQQYAESVRAERYIGTRAEDDYAALTNDVARALNDVARTKEASKRLDIVEQARKELAGWPAAHYNYRWEDVQQMLSMLDEAIADLRASSGVQRFDLALSAYSQAPPSILVPKLPPPTPQQAIEQTLLASRLVASSAERGALLSAALISLDRDAAALPADWAAAAREEARAILDVDRKIDGEYQALTRRVMTLADGRARAADVRGVEQLVARVRQEDAALGGKRPAVIESLVDAVQAKLDAARRFRLARDRWALRAPILRRYRTEVAEPLGLLTRLGPALDDIKTLAGSSPGELALIGRTVARILKIARAINPPTELAAAHALIVSAAQLANQAAAIRREAMVTNSMPRAWDASSAAAGALMLSARAATEIEHGLKPPRYQ